VTQAEIEREALRKESDGPSRERLGRIEKELADLGTELSALRAQWEDEKQAQARIAELKRQIDHVRQEIENSFQEAKTAVDPEPARVRAAKLQYEKLPGLERSLAEAVAVSSGEERPRLVREEVTAEDIAAIVARWTGIPVSRLLASEKEKLLDLPEILHRRVIGQDEAVRAVADAVLRARAGLSDPERPTGSFLFLGPTGVGKTELARALAEALFDDEKNMIRVDMSEYQERHTVARLIGAPPGYVGFEEGGQLTEAVRRKPYAVVLLDEVEKAHPEVFNVLLQVLDDGRMTDGHGRTVNFKNTLIIMTSNVGSDLILEQLTGHVEDERAYERVRDSVLELLRRQFRPEFLNRVDEQIVFRPLGREELREIVRLQIDRLRERFDEQRIELLLTAEAEDLLADVGYDPVWGARPLKRAIQRELETPLARRLIAGEIGDGDAVTVDRGDDGLAFTVSRPAGERTRVE